MKIISIAIAISMASFGAIASNTDDNFKYRIDPDEIIYIDSNMLWDNNCEFQLNNKAGANNLVSDGKFTGNYWKETMGVLCDNVFVSLKDI